MIIGHDHVFRNQAAKRMNKGLAASLLAVIFKVGDCVKKRYFCDYLG
jgi:hypothetical protein